MLTSDRPNWRTYTAWDLQACAEREANWRRRRYQRQQQRHGLARPGGRDQGELADQPDKLLAQD